jgi:hypothetical protein
MRASWCALVATACSFRHGAMTSDSTSIDAAVDTSVVDTRIADAPGVCNGKLWLADFSTDPTALDVNGDGVADWALRDGSSFPTAQLVGGVWSTPSASVALDTQPKQDFTTRVLIHVRMRNTTVGGARGAVFWINVGYDAGNSFAPLYVDAKLQGAGTQTLSFWTKNAVGVEQLLDQATSLPPDFLDVDLDVDPTTLRVKYAGGGITGTSMLVRQPQGSATDKWATVVAYSGASEFDMVRVEVCP